jgi:glutamate formiminotransferase/formiminotetrahydrofolate cyclodeaminase
VTGSELVGLVPLHVMLSAGRYFLEKQQRSTGVSEAELIRIAVRSLGLSELRPFEPRERIIDYLLEEPEGFRLVDRSVTQFVDQTASETPAPGGGSTAALLGALGAALGTMVANLSAHKRGWDARWKEFSDWADRGQALKAALLRLVDEDTRAYNRVLAAMGMPKATEAEKAARAAALEAANVGAIEVPFRVMEASFATFPLLETMVDQGNPASASDGAVGALAARSAVLGAWLNVRTNVPALKNPGAVQSILERGARMAAEAVEYEDRIRRLAESKIG